MRYRRKKIPFEWDTGNSTKNWIRHNITIEETEEAFYDSNALIDDDKTHSTETEKRHVLIGKTRKGKLLYIAFTVRGECVRPISSRKTDRKEAKIYEERIKSTNIQK